MRLNESSKISAWRRSSASRRRARENRLGWPGGENGLKRRQWPKSKKSANVAISKAAKSGVQSKKIIMAAGGEENIGSRNKAKTRKNEIKRQWHVASMA